MRFLDTNIIVRYLTRDDEEKAAACYELFQRLKHGTEEVTTCEAVIAEVAYVLASRAHYALSHEQVRARLAPILALRGLKIPNRRVYLRALDLYASYRFLDIEDALLLAHMERRGTREIISYDSDFDQIPGTKRLVP